MSYTTIMYDSEYYMFHMLWGILRLITITIKIWYLGRWHSSKITAKKAYESNPNSSFYWGTQRIVNNNDTSEECCERIELSTLKQTIVW